MHRILFSRDDSESDDEKSRLIRRQNERQRQVVTKEYGVSGKEGNVRSLFTNTEAAFTLKCCGPPRKGTDNLPTEHGAGTRFPVKEK